MSLIIEHTLIPEGTLIEQKVFIERKENAIILCHKFPIQFLLCFLFLFQFPKRKSNCVFILFQCRLCCWNETAGIVWSCADYIELPRMKGLFCPFDPCDKNFLLFSYLNNEWKTSILGMVIPLYLKRVSYVIGIVPIFPTWKPICGGSNRLK